MSVFVIVNVLTNTKILAKTIKWDSMLKNENFCCVHQGVFTNPTGTVWRYSLYAISYLTTYVMHARARPVDYRWLFYNWRNSLSHWNQDCLMTQMEIIFPRTRRKQEFSNIIGLWKHIRREIWSRFLQQVFCSRKDVRLYTWK